MKPFTYYHINLRVCMYVFMYVYMYVCMYVCMHAYMLACVCMCMYVCMFMTNGTVYLIHMQGLNALLSLSYSTH